MKVKMNKHAWSQESKHSYSYDSETDYYEDITYKCEKCNTNALFTAREQKEAYEHQKIYIWTTRRLCHMCYKNYKELKKQLNEYQHQWNQESESSKITAPYKKAWLMALNEVHLYGKPINESMVNHLTKLLNENA